jgi:hypothetical protein
MKQIYKDIFFIIFCTIGLIFTVFVEHSYAALPYVQNFDSLSNGNFTAWDLTQGSYFQIMDSGNNYFGTKILDANPANSTNYQYDFSPNSSSGVYASAWFKTDGNGRNQITFFNYPDNQLKIYGVGVDGGNIKCGEDNIQAISTGVWYWLQMETRTSDQKVRCRYKEIGGEVSSWSSYRNNGSGWGGSDAMGWVGFYAGAGSGHVYIDNFQMGSGSAPDGDIPSNPITNNLSITYPVNNSTTTSSYFWEGEFFTNQNYYGDWNNSLFFTWKYGTSSTTWEYIENQTWVFDILANATSYPQFLIHHTFEIGTPYYVQLTFSSSSQIIATSSIITFNSSRIEPTPFISPSIPATTTEAFLGECSSFGWPMNWLCDVYNFLFIPNATVLNNFMNAKDDFLYQAPAGYLTLFIDEWNDISISSSSTPSITMQVDFGNGLTDIKIFDMTLLPENLRILIHTFCTWGLWIFFLIYLYWNIKGLFQSF